MKLPGKILISIFLTIIILNTAYSHDTDSVPFKSKQEKYVTMTPHQLTTSAYDLLGSGQIEEALMVNEIILLHTEDSKDRGERGVYVNALNNTGCIYLFQYQNHEKAYQYFLKAKRLAAEYGFPGLLGGIYDNIAKIYADFGAIDDAMSTYSEAFMCAINDTIKGSDDIRLMIFNDLANFAVSQDKIYDIKGSLEVFDGLPLYNLPMGKYSKELCSALLSLINGNTEECILALVKAYDLIDHPIGRERYQTEHLLTLATVYHMGGRNKEAMATLSEALRKVQQNEGQNDLYVRIYKGMSKVESVMGNQEAADKLRLQAYLTKDSLYAIKAYSKIVSLEPTMMIDSLAGEMREAEANHRHRLTLLWVMAVAIVLISLLLLFIVRRSRKLAQSYQMLAEKHNESVRQQEAASKLRREYEDVIIRLHNEIDQLKESCPTTNDAYHKASRQESLEKRSYVPVSEMERLKIIGDVNKVMEESEEVYSSDFSLDRLAEIIGTKPRYLSSLINDSFGKTFSELVGEIRIKMACGLITSPEFKKTMTLEGVAANVGYKSRTHFNSIFKKVTGLTPSQYIASVKI